MLGVSKLCCPVCWELLELLRQDDNSALFAVRGCHSTIYPIALPPFTPPDIRQKMTKLFQKHLCDGLKLLTAQAQRGSRPTHQSTNSESGFSNASNLECGKVQDEDDDFNDSYTSQLLQVGVNHD